MRERQLSFEPFELIDLTEYSGVKELNKHGIVHFSGLIDGSDTKKYLQMGMNEIWVTVKAHSDTGGIQILFYGIVTDLDVCVEGDVTSLSVELQSGTYLMEHSLHTRTFQNSGITYSTILNTCLSNYESGSAKMISGCGSTISSFVAQYKESDWEFAKRLASHFHTVLVPEMQTRGVRFYFGVPNNSSDSITTKIFSVKKQIKEYVRKRDKGLSGIQEMDAVYYIVKNRDIYNLGDNIVLNGKSMYVVKIESELEGSELYHTYYLKSKKGMEEPKSYNYGLVGASLNGTIKAVQRDVVQVEVTDDENSNSGVRWFPYSTVYSSPDGTGWYCMPEPGDSVRVYMPSEDEADAYVISSTHTSTCSGEARSNPDNKSIMNKYGKEVLFTPNSLIMTNNKGMSIEILDEEGIRIISNKEISIKSEEKIDIGSSTGDVQVIAPEAITLTQGDTTTKLMDNVLLKGSQVNME